MVTITYDGSINGFFTVVFEVYFRKLTDLRIYVKGYEPPVLIGDVLYIHTEEAKAKRVISKLYNIGGKPVIDLYYKCILSEQQGIENHMLAALQYSIKSYSNVFADYGNFHVLKLREIEKKMRRERHRMTAFVRFKHGRDSLYYSIIEPDFDVIPLIIDHFEGRYADQKWLIYDAKRKYGIYYDLNQTVFMYPTPGNQSSGTVDISLFEPEEELYQQLWKTYFKSTNISERKNLKLHLQHVPRRYWKYLVEKETGIHG